ncbi:MAG TPA: TadE/TadG family type IV pilus assembly protein [Rhizomicrobium sp.]|nr:TadE/TadG family type IV pilus assembly protein [Rhizomicrobium sp.]
MKPGNARHSLIRRFLRTGEGATAVEFAMVAPAFIALLYAILQTALVFFAQQVLQTATLQAARQILTGQAQAANMTQSQFQQLVCANASGLFNCAGVYAAVQTFTTFPNVTMYNPISNGKFSGSNMPFSPGAPGDVEVVQVFYQWPVWPGPLNFTLANASGNTNVLVATAAFRNEP